MKTGIIAVTTLLCLGGFLSAPAFAQTGSTPAPTTATAATSAGADYHGDYEAGVNFFDRVLNRGVTTTYSPGWYAGASYRIIRVVSVVGEIGGDYKSSRYVYAFQGGARFQSGTKSARVRPFAQVLFGSGLDNGGIGQLAARNHFPVLTPGGGTDVRIGNHLAARLKLDFPLYATFGDVHKGFRLSLGISVPLGTK
ncbi:MAG TPA: hypothetical protein VGL62_00010 [Vicinamibacterales bacterium]